MAEGRKCSSKAVAQAIPIYTMVCFRPPSSLCADLNSMCARFWWGQGKGHRKVHWQRWKWMSVTKEIGDLDFEILKFFNEAMLAK